VICGDDLSPGGSGGVSWCASALGAACCFGGVGGVVGVVCSVLGCGVVERRMSWWSRGCGARRAVVVL